MVAIIPGCLVAGLVLSLPAMALAQNVDDYLTISPQVGGSALRNVFLVVGVMIAVAMVVMLYNRLFGQREQRQKAPAKVARKKRVDFAQQAAKLGFRIVEIKTLRALASQLAPQDPDFLLTTDAGRERLIDDLRERIHKREREIEVLRGIHDKLNLIRDHQMHERASVRVETDLAVWVVKKSSRGPEAESEEEEIFADVEQVGGRLLDLSEGGAALVADLDAKANDLLELWSADSEIWIPPVTAGVLQVEKRADLEGRVFHVHFIDPPLSELRAAIQTIQREAGSRAS